MTVPTAPPPLPPSEAPFTLSHTAEVPDLLAQLRCSLALTTYQAGKVLVLSPTGEKLIQLARTFQQPMGLAVAGFGPSLRLAVATKDAVEEFINAPGLAAGYPRQPDTYDALLLSRRTHHTGPLDLHDLVFDGRPGVLAVNTRFSCLARVGVGVHSFEPVWTPPFISALDPSDRCHLNGLAVDADRQPRVVSALGATDTPRGWADGRLTGGILIDVDTGETLVSGLAMPHSPRLVSGTDGGDGLWVLNSAEGTLGRVEVDAGTFEPVCDVGGFGRGLAQRGDYLFVGVSKIRRASTFAGLPVSERSREAGVCIVHAPTGRLAGRISYRTSVEEVYDVVVLPEVARPGLVAPWMDVAGRAVTVEGAGWWAHDAPPAAPGRPDPARLGAEAGGAGG